jgi:hypothetical protein
MCPKDREYFLALLQKRESFAHQVICCHHLMEPYHQTISGAGATSFSAAREKKEHNLGSSQIVDPVRAFGFKGCD